MNSVKTFRSAAMRLIAIVTTAAYIFTFGFPAPVLAEQKIEVPAGTSLTLKTVTNLSPKQLRVGDQLELVVVNDVIVNEKVIVKGGARARGEVTSSKEHSYIGIAGKMGFTLKNVTAVDGTLIPVSGNRYIEGPDKMVVSIGLSIICCLLFALMKGGEADIPSGTLVEASVMVTTPVTIK